MKNKTPYIFLGTALVLAVSAVVLLIMKPGNPDSAKENEQGSTSLPVATDEVASSVPEPIENLDQEIDLEDPEDALGDTGVALSAASPEELLKRISEALEKGDMETVSKLAGKSAFDADGLARLSKLAGDQNSGTDRSRGIREVGEITLNEVSRWELDLDPDGTKGKRIYFDLERDGDQWRIGKVIVPDRASADSGQGLLDDALATADAFLQAVLEQDFEAARRYVDQASVSEAKIAGLCILFEEGNYKLRPSKPLRAMFTRDDRVGYLANVITEDGAGKAEFALNLGKVPGSANWRIFEINLDQLLADYAKQVAGGDIYYSPLVENPSGGETLALYFEFDEDSMSPRTRRQLEIVASMLKTDPAKKITLSGHTDALGSQGYNNELSANRAEVVRDYLVEAGVSAEQIVTIAKGASQPRRPNATESGEDNPEGRRANRRTEIYLDF